MFKKQFQLSGHAFLLHEHHAIIVDGAIVLKEWFTSDHLSVIQAHEIGHYMAGHGSVTNETREAHNIEQEADWLGYFLLKNKKMFSAAKLHEEEYVLRYGIPPYFCDKTMKHIRNLV
jgi:hypothetical protein